MGNSDLDRVKQILLGDVVNELRALKEELADDERLKDQAARVISEALDARTRADNSVSEVLAPVIERAISSSIEKDPKKLAVSLYPIMGPAIRKSITETLQQMMENFNQLLEDSLSPQSMRWRFDAWRTGRSYSELVMLNTLVFRIEQVFLIHRATSLLLQHHSHDLSATKDPDMVSGMFSAIQDFIEDSFSTQEGDVLDTLRLGELTVVIQRGPHAVLAAVVRGRVPENLRENLNETLEKLHRIKRTTLNEFEGDTSDFDDFEGDVRALLQSERKEPVETEKKIPWLAIVVIVLLLSGAGYWYYVEAKRTSQRAQAVALFDQQPGIVLLRQSFDDNVIKLVLLVDPDATPPLDILAPDQDEFSVQYTTYSYLSQEDLIMHRRATRILAPEPGTVVTVTNGILTLGGTATKDWLASFTRQWPAVTGVSGVDLAALTITDPALEAIMNLKGSVESYEFDFDKGAETLDLNSTSLKNLVADLHALVIRATTNAMSIRIDVVGYTDETGTVALNRRIGQARAKSVRDSLITSGINANLVTAFSGLDYLKGATTTERKVKLVVHLTGTSS